MLTEGCVRYLARIVDMTKKEITELFDVCVVCKFLDVFPENFPRLASDREIEFEIEFLLGTAPIFKASSRMAPTELKELKQQLQELLHKKFILPSYLPWGAPILFREKEK